VIELDGGGHYLNNQKQYDESRTKFLELNGLKVLRFNNNEITYDLDGVLKSILEELS
jgi:very-short-patch-repair endonuclease